MVESFPPLFLSMGLLNLVFIGDDPASLEPIKAFSHRERLHSETWHLSDNRIVSTEVSRPETEPPPTDRREPLSNLDPTLVTALREYQLLFTTAIDLTRRWAPALADDLARFDSVFRQWLTDADIGNITKQGQVVIANAALSRQVSQTFGGASPIIDNASHYWLHSLLGIGTATLALANIRRFVETAASEAQVVRRLELLEEEAAAPGVRIPFNWPLSHPFWKKDHLFGYPAQQALSPGVLDDVLPQIVCFSGRDGFRSTPFSLSLPLESVSSCNTSAWTLMTVTHELSHGIVEPILGLMIPDPADAAALTELSRCFVDGPRNLLSQLRASLYFAVWRMDCPDSDMSCDARDISHLIRQKWRAANELLTHMIDFLYFYGKDADKYISSLWSSWSVIPNIANRVPDYLLRSLAALYTSYLELPPGDGLGVTMDEALTCLRSTDARIPGSQYVSMAIDELETKRARYEEALFSRRPLAILAKQVLYSEELARRLAPLRAEGEWGGVTTNEFNADRVTNPLAFIEHQSRHTIAPMMNESAWLLQQLAFGEY